MVKIVFAHSASKIAFIRLHVACFVFLWLFFCVFLHVDGKLCFFLFSFFVFLLCLPVRLCLLVCLRALPFCAVECLFCLPARTVLCACAIEKNDKIVILSTTYSTFRVFFVFLFPLQFCFSVCI